MGTIPIAIQTHHVHLWLATLAWEKAGLDVLRSLLNDEERARADRFKVEEPGTRFTAARGLLRTVLSRYTGEAPDKLKFFYGIHGKPELMQSRGDRRLSFNVSHSGDLLLCAVALNRSVGVDIEEERSDINFEDIAKRFFSDAEYDTLKVMPEGEKRQCFYRIWTRKEAYVKARGRTLSELLRAVKVHSGTPVMTLRDENTLPWFIADLDVPPPFHGALAVEGKDVELHYRRLLELP